MNNKKVITDDLMKDILEGKLAEEEILRQSLEEKKKQAEEYYDQLLRLKAEFENYRKRVEKEKEKIYLHGKETIFLKLVTVLDTLEQAEKSLANKNEKLSPQRRPDEEARKTEDIIKGLKLIILDFRNFLGNEGLEPIESVGKKFDPHFHEVVEREEKEDLEEGIILEELQKGYLFNGQVIRPAKVKIAKHRLTQIEKNTDTTDKF